MMRCSTLHTCLGLIAGVNLIMMQTCMVWANFGQDLSQGTKPGWRTMIIWLLVKLYHLERIQMGLAYDGDPQKVNQINLK